MMDQLTSNSIQRAFQLAQSGKYSVHEELIAALRAQGFDTEVITGPTLRKQLRVAMRNATAAAQH